MFDFVKNLFSTQVDEKIAEVIHNGAKLIDVRSPQEFADGNVKGSINIPVDRLAHHIHELKKTDTFVVFCRSGNRSGMAKAILAAKGFNNVFDGKTWNNVNNIVNSY